jgi:hypothetical protein
MRDRVYLCEQNRDNSLKLHTTHGGQLLNETYIIYISASVVALLPACRFNPQADPPITASVSRCATSTNFILSGRAVTAPWEGI